MPVSRLAPKDWSKLLSWEPDTEAQCERETRRYCEARAFVQFTGILFYRSRLSSCCRRTVLTHEAAGFAYVASICAFALIDD